MYLFFTHSSVDGHLGCFHVLAAVNSAAVNTGAHVSFQIWFLLGVCPGVGLLDHMVVLFLFFWGTSILFSILAAPIYIPIFSTESVFPKHNANCCSLTLLKLFCGLYVKHSNWRASRPLRPPPLNTSLASSLNSQSSLHLLPPHKHKQLFVLLLGSSHSQVNHAWGLKPI